MNSGMRAGLRSSLLILTVAVWPSSGAAQAPSPQAAASETEQPPTAAAAILTEASAPVGHIWHGIDFRPLTLFEFLYLTVTFAAAAAALYSIRILIRQAKGSSDAAVNEAQIAADRIFVDHPHLRKYFLQGCDISDADEDYPQALAAAQLLANYFESYFCQRRQASQLYTDATWRAYIAEHLRNSPLLCRYLEHYSSWYTFELLSLKELAPSISGNSAGHPKGDAPYQAVATRDGARTLLPADSHATIDSSAHSVAKRGHIRARRHRH